MCTGLQSSSDAVAETVALLRSQPPVEVAFYLYFIARELRLAGGLTLEEEDRVAAIMNRILSSPDKAA